MSTDSTSSGPIPPPTIEFEPNPPVAQPAPSAVPPAMPPPSPSPPVEYSAPSSYVPPAASPALPLDTVPATQPATSDSFSPRKAAIEMGYDAEIVNQFETDEAFFKGMTKALEQAGEDQQYTAMGRQVAPKWDKVQQVLADAEPVAPVVPEVDPWPSCKRDPAYAKLPRDAQGNHLCNDITDAPVAANANSFEAMYRDRVDGFVNDPMEQIRRAGLDKYLDERDERMRSEYRGEFEARDVASVQQDHLQKNLTEYCQADTQGNLAYDRGNLILTQKGRAYQHYLSQGQEHWKIPPAQAHEYAVRQVEADTALGAFGAQPGQTSVAQAQPGQTQLGPPPNTAAPSPAQVGQQQRDSFLNEAQASLQQAPGTSTTNRDGTFPGSDDLAPLQNADESVKEMANNVLSESGLPTQ